MTIKLRSKFGTLPQRLVRDTRGVTLAFVALAGSVLIGFTGLAVETGLWYAIKRYNQSAADIAALSGATEQAGGQPYSDVCKLAKLAAQANGFNFVLFSCPNSTPACTSPATGQMCANNPPASGPNTANASAVEVILAQQQTTFFAGLFLPNLMIDARAVAGNKPFNSCMIALGTPNPPLGTPSYSQDLKINPNSIVKLINCSFISDSNALDSIIANGDIYLSAGSISTVGGAEITGNSNYIAPPITTGGPFVADPYAGQITVPALAGGDTCVNFGAGSNTLKPSVGAGGAGWYGCAGNNPAINLTSGSTTTFCPGVYLLDGEDNQGEAFVISANSTVVNMGIAGNTYNGVTCPNNGTNGVTIIATCQSAGCTSGGGFVIGGQLNNQPTVTLSAPTASPQIGIPQEVLFYQVANTADTQKGDSTIAGGPKTSLNGVVYTPATQITLQGSPTLGSCTEFIALNFVIDGTSTMNAPAAGCGINTARASALVLLE
jgi:hypothetical protein